MADKELLDDAVERLKSQMAKAKEQEWRDAYLKGINKQTQSLNITRGVQWSN